MADTPPFVTIDEPTPTPNVDASLFLRRMRLATYTLVITVLSIYLLEKFSDVLKPLFIATFITFMMLPMHRWLVRQRIPSLIAYVVIVGLVSLALFGVGSMMYSDITVVAGKMTEYEDRLDRKVRGALRELPFRVPEPKEHYLRDLFTPEDVMAAARTALGGFRDFTTLAAATFLILLFLLAEKVSFPRRLALAFGEHHGARVLGIVDSINQAIGQYIAVKTLASALAGLLSFLVVGAFDVEFAATWGILIFLLNYIPYLGSLTAVSLPIVLSFLQFDDIWPTLIIAVLLIAIQQGIGAFIEPRMAGQRLDVSPILIVLSLAFWWTLWGIIGAILAVPLLVIVRIVLDSIPETKPIATLMSNR